MKHKKRFIPCRTSEIEEIYYTKEEIKYYPFISSSISDDMIVEIASPLHGRSLIADYNSKNKRYTITKGNGLTYFPWEFVYTGEMEDLNWGYLNKKDAIRDYLGGNFIKKLGILTNEMEAVYALKIETLKNSESNFKIQPIILQYTVSCPYRIADIPFLSKKIINKYTKNWSDLFGYKSKNLHCIAANVLLKNIKIMHEENVLHNAISSQNYTLLLELVDFELARTPATPYESQIDEILFEKLKNREVIQSLEIVNQIAFYFNETIDFVEMNQIMHEYGFQNYLQ